MMFRPLLLPLVVGIAYCQPPKASEKAAIEGIVADATTGDPLRKAYVTLLGAFLQDPITISGPNGHFAFSGVDPGDYGLHVERQGYLDLDYRSPIHLAAGQKLAGVRLSLTRYAAISGRVMDSDGDPWRHADVSVLRIGWKKGKRQLQQQGETSVNDRGEFRIADLRPGRYFVRATAELNGLNPHSDFLPTYYPTVLDTSAATPVIVRAAEELNGIDVQLKTGTVHHIRGRVIGLPKPSASKHERLFVIAQRSSAWVDSLQSLSGTLKPNGDFEIPGAPPGTYELELKSVRFVRIAPWKDDSTCRGRGRQ